MIIECLQNRVDGGHMSRRRIAIGIGRGAACCRTISLTPSRHGMIVEQRSGASTRTSTPMTNGPSSGSPDGPSRRRPKSSSGPATTSSTESLNASASDTDAGAQPPRRRIVRRLLPGRRGLLGIGSPGARLAETTADTVQGRTSVADRDRGRSWLDQRWCYHGNVDHGKHPAGLRGVRDPGLPSGS
jgi:hypothetical protein